MLRGCSLSDFVIGTALHNSYLRNKAAGRKFLAALRIKFCMLDSRTESKINVNSRGESLLSPRDLTYFTFGPPVKHTNNNNWSIKAFHFHF